MSEEFRSPGEIEELVARGHIFRRDGDGYRDEFTQYLAEPKHFDGLIARGIVVENDKRFSTQFLDMGPPSRV
jgi:hypothetical protein